MITPRPYDPQQENGRYILSRKKKVLITAGAVLALLLILFVLWIRGMFLPGYVTWNSDTKSVSVGAAANETPATDAGTSADTDRAGEYLLTLKNKTLRISRDGNVIFKTPFTWLISDVLTGDIDRDGDDELLLLLWKHWEYMGVTPFWDKGSKIPFSQHIFIYEFDGNDIAPKWMASRLPCPVADWKLDLSYRVCIKDPEGNESCWQWDNFGLKLVEHPQNKISMIAVGDNLTHKTIYTKCYDRETGTFNFDPIYEDVRDTISSYDIAVVNQETIFVEKDSDISDFPRFGTPFAMADALANAGFNVVLHATNHVNDKGTAAIEKTLKYWHEHYPDIAVLGINERIHYLEKNGIKLALFNYTEHLNGHEPDEEHAYMINTFKNIDSLYSDLKEAEDKCDISVCFLHAGEEYSTEPTDELKDIIEKIIDAGADVIICSHPHIVQEYEEVMTGSGNIALVYYSLGNFMSGQTEPGTDTGGAAVLTIEKDKDGKTYVTEHSLKKTECHSTPNGVSVLIHK